jgi:zinc ribbon protein
VLVCPSCATGHEDGERFCGRCGTPLVHADPVAPRESERRDRARKIRPQYAEGPLVKVVGARNQAEAELLQGMLLEEGVPSLMRRSGGFDVPDFLASGPRDILVPSSGAEAAREILQLPEPAEGIGMAPGEGTPAWVKAMAVALTVVILAIIAAGVYAAVF